MQNIPSSERDAIDVTDALMFIASVAAVVVVFSNPLPIVQRTEAPTPAAVALIPPPLRDNEGLILS